MITLYEYPPSGNSHKIHMLIHYLGLEHKNIIVDLLKGESRTPDFLAKQSPNGRIPVIELEDGRTLWESGAILFYLAEGTPFFPTDPWKRAKVMQWMFFEQYTHEPAIAVLRWQRHGLNKKPEELGERYHELLKNGYAALDLMEQHLGQSDYFVDDFSIADIALYAYTHVAHEGDFDLSQYPHIKAWIKRIESRPDHLPMEDF